MSETPHVHIVTALMCEARPLIDALKLKRIHSHSPFTIFSNGEIFLIISGIGKINAAAATTFLHAMTQLPSHAFYINLGIAGSDRPVGELVAAHKITDAQSQHVWYPNINLHKFKHTANLVTVDQPRQDYSNNTLIDMEASGFFPIAAKFAGHDQVQVLKVVSDNHENPIANINAHKVTQFIENKLDALLLLLKKCLELSQQEAALLPDKALLNAIMAQCHFTNYQQHQLADFIRRRKINFPDEAIFEKLKIFKDSEQILNFFKN
jgi:hypothetical protein